MARYQNTGIPSRARPVSAAFVKIADTLVADYDVVDLLYTLVDESVALLDTSAAGLLLVDPAGELQVMASTSEKVQQVELLQLEEGAGPCLECFQTGTVVKLDDIAAEGSPWPAFQAEAVSQGFAAVHAVPMRLRGNTIGALNLFHTQRGPLSPEDAAIDQAFVLLRSYSRAHRRSLLATSRDVVDRAIAITS